MLPGPARARIQTASAALNPLYSRAIGPEYSGQFPIVGAVSFRFAEPANLTTANEASAFSSALNGRTVRLQTLAGQGSTFVDGLFIPTVLAHVGASFKWATPTQVTERANLVVPSMVARTPVNA